MRLTEGCTARPCGRKVYGIRAVSPRPPSAGGDFMIIRVVLDTCTARKHVRNRTPQFDINLIKHKRVNFRVSLYLGLRGADPATGGRRRPSRPVWQSGFSRTHDEDGASLGRNDRESRGKRGPLCELAVGDHRECERTAWSGSSACSGWSARSGPCPG